jgi:hypothetical protein
MNEREAEFSLRVPGARLAVAKQEKSCVVRYLDQLSSSCTPLATTWQ